MSKKPLRFAFSLASILAWAAMAGCPEPAPQDDPQQIETVVKGRAPLNAGGTVRITAHEGYKAGQTFEGPIDDTGHFSVKMQEAVGKFTLAASGGTYVEPATGTTVRHAGETLRAAIVDAQQLGEAEVAVTPWTEIAYSRGGVEGYAESLKILGGGLGCGVADYARLLLAPPAIPTPDKPVQSLSVDALAYVYLGAFSQLAADLSDRLGLQPGARLTSMRLAKAVAADFVDGRIDGRQNGARIWLIDGHPLPENILRQPLAQAMRRFVGSKGNETSLREAAVLDLLRCVSLGSDLQLGPVGEPLDIEGPTLTFVTPAAGAHLASSQELVCEANDVSGVATLNGALWRGDEELRQALGDVVTATENKTNWRLKAPLRIEQTSTGGVQFRCEATDAWGNSRVAVHDLHINRGGIAPRLVVNADDLNALAGSVGITCACSDDPYSHRCELTSPESGRAATLASQGDRTSLYTWDTRGVLDGRHVLTCSNWTRGIAAPVTQSLTARVKNSEPGRATGVVFLDTPVEHVSVTAYAYQNGVQGQELGTAEAPDGAFSVPITNEYRGPVLLVAAASRNPAVDQPQARFHNIPLNAGMSLDNGKLRLLLEEYEPGQVFTGLSINVASTMAEALSSAMWERGIGEPATFFDAAQAGHRLVAQYLNPTRPFDPRRTRVANLGSSARLAADNEVMLGLFHVGLSRLAVEYSIAHCQRRNCITVAHFVDGMRQDLSDGRLDGQDVNQARIRLGNGAFMGEDFFRIELARAIRRWLDRAAFLDDPQPSINNAELVPREFVPHLQSMAAHDSRLFGNRQGTRYDDEGPVLTVQVLGQDGRPFDLNGNVGRVRIRVVVDGQDDTGVVWIRASLEGRQLENAQPARGDHAEFWVDTSDIPDGDAQIAIDSQDGNGNPAATRYINLVVDKLEPKIELDAPDLWIRDGEQHRISGTVSKARVTVQIFEGTSPLTDAVELQNGERRFALQAPVACPAHHTLTVKVRDSAGNTSEVQQGVHCDNTPPAFLQQPSPFTQEKSGQAIELTARLVPDPKEFRLTSASAAPVVEKLWNRLDNRPEHAPPTLRFLVNDIGASAVGTPAGNLKVSYKYFYQGAGGTHERDWTPVACNEAGLCQIAMSYQTMLPADVLAEPVSVARNRNFIARSGVEDLHSILIKVEDLAGNVTLAEWAMRLSLFAPPVDIDCGLHPALLNTRLTSAFSNGPSTVANAAAPNFPAHYVNLATSFGVDEASLTPSIASHSFAFGDAPLQWRIDRAMQQVAKIGQAGVHLDWRNCPHNHDFPVSLLFSDGECQHLKRGNTYPRQWGWSRQLPMHNDLLSVQTLKPRHPSAELRSGAEAIHNPFFSVEPPQKLAGGGGPYPITTERAVQGHYETQFGFRFGWEYGGEIHTYIDERRFIRDMRVIRDGGYNVIYTGSSTGTPPPVRVNYAPACTQTITASWREDRAPLVQVGPAPAIHDLSSGYGPQP
jgi:hypothetical protein